VRILKSVNLLGCRSGSGPIKHEKMMHPGLRAQRLRDWGQDRKDKPRPRRIHSCGFSQGDKSIPCPVAFSSTVYLTNHRVSYCHQTDAKKGKDKAKELRQQGLKNRPAKKVRKMKAPTIKQSKPGPTRAAPAAGAKRAAPATAASKNPRPRRKPRYAYTFVSVRHTLRTFLHPTPPPSFPRTVSKPTAPLEGSSDSSDSERTIPGDAESCRGKA
jgi:hypothetical protein